MKTFGTLIYRLVKIALIFVFLAFLFEGIKALESIATELRISNEMTMCIEDPNCTLNNEM